MKHWFILFTAIITLSACKKKEEKQYSVWYVDNNKINTNDVELAEGKALVILSGRAEGGNHFEIRFKEFSSLPNDGKFLVRNFNSENAPGAYMGFYVNAKWYDAVENNEYRLQASTVNSKRRLTLESTWFTHIDSLGSIDSVLVYGEFNEP